MPRDEGFDPRVARGDAVALGARRDLRDAGRGRRGGRRRQGRVGGSGAHRIVVSGGDDVRGRRARGATRGDDGGARPLPARGLVGRPSARRARRASRSSRRRSTHESPCRKRTCSAVVAASRAARASSANVVSTANNDPVRARSANPTLTAPPSSSPAPSVAQVASRPESDRVAPRNARIKPFIARHRATTDASSFGYTRSKASTFSPELVSSIATLRTERSVRVGSRTPRRVIVRVSGKAGVPPATANAHAARPGFECTNARLMRLQGARYLRSL